MPGQASSATDAARLFKLLGEAKLLGKEYYELTGRPLGITGEVAEYEAARLLDVELSSVRQAGYDAVRKRGREKQLLQIKGRCLLPGAKPGQRLGSIDLTKPWDAVLMVLLDEHFEATAIYEADRSAITEALTKHHARATTADNLASLSSSRSGIGSGRSAWGPGEQRKADTPA